MEPVAFVVGLAAVLAVLVDMINTLVTTQTASGRWWLTIRLYRSAWWVIRGIASRITTDSWRERLLATFAPVSVFALLVVWVTQQIIGFGLMWWAVGGVDGASSLFDSIYFSGVVYFTLGFGELVPVEVVPRIGALFEAFSGVLTTALVIGYLPALYSAYSERERKLLTLDDGTEERISPQSLLMARAPDGSLDALQPWFAEWEQWVAGVIETHSTFPMLVLFRSKDPGQHWVTALGVVTDMALQCQMIEGAANREAYWLVRRSIRLFDQLTRGVDLSSYRRRLDEGYTDSEGFRNLHSELGEFGFATLDFDAAREVTVGLRRRYDAAMEYLIDELLAPRGFWGHAIGHRSHRSSQFQQPVRGSVLDD